jgi:hypothetical protein
MTLIDCPKNLWINLLEVIVRMHVLDLIPSVGWVVG